MILRDATSDDWPVIWPIVREVVRAGDTYTWDPDVDELSARALWMHDGEAGWRVFVAEVDGEVVATAKTGPNQGGGGSHVANGSFMVAPRVAGRGVGRALAEHAIAAAAADGYRAMQFNAVVQANTRAVALWRSLGFDDVGTVPDAFLHPSQGYVGLHVMHRSLV